MTQGPPPNPPPAPRPAGVASKRAEAGAVPARPPRTPTLQEVQLGSETEPYRPIHRLPGALLCILDNGPNDGEWIRIRSDRVVIGRTEGDVLIPHDPLVSSRHAELTRVSSQGKHYWQLTDLDSTNGTYARVTKAVLEPGQEILLGRGRYRFDSPLDRAAATAAAGNNDDDEQISTWRWAGNTSRGLVPTLVELLDQGEGLDFMLECFQENWIGRDPRKCKVVLNDSMVDLQHAVIHREATARWYLRDGKSLNGTWVRIQQLRIKSVAHFQLGEQRFLLKLSP